MPTLTPILRKDFNADADIKPNRIVAVTATGVTTATAGSHDAIGISYPEVSVKTGQMANVILAGIAEVSAGGAIAVGDFVTAKADGQAVATTTSGDIVIGRALKASASADEIIPVLINTFMHK